MKQQYTILEMPAFTAWLKNLLTGKPNRKLPPASA